MKAVKNILLGLVALVVVLLVVGLLLPGTWKVERSIVINAPAARIYPLVADLRNGWPKWSEFQKADPATTHEYSGPASGKGATDAWKSKKMGDGSSTIVAAEKNKRLEMDVKMVMMKNTDHGSFTFVPEGKATRVTWADAGDVGSNPVGHLFAKFLMDRMLGGYFEKSLASLKDLAEGAKK